MQHIHIMIFTFHIWYVNQNSKLFRYCKVPISELYHKLLQRASNSFTCTRYSPYEVSQVHTRCAKYVSNTQQRFCIFYLNKIFTTNRMNRKIYYRSATSLNGHRKWNAIFSAAVVFQCWSQMFSFVEWADDKEIC